MNTDLITILDFQPADQPCFEELYRVWFTKHFQVPPEHIDEFMLTQPEKAILERGGAIQVAFYADKRAGFVALKKEDGYSYELTKMVIREEYRGKGLGEALCRSAIGKAGSLDATRIVLYTHSSLKAAINLYRKLGFEEIPLETGHYSSFRCDIKMELCLDKLNHV